VDPRTPGAIQINAIGWIHTHYWDCYNGRIQIEAVDAADAIATNTYAVVGTPTILIPIGPDGKLKGYTQHTH
jgi:hypothetical protein